jgi:autophagy-related protein 17
MSSPPEIRPDNLVSLVLQSKKALQTGEQLCSRANDLSNASAQSAVDVLALDAKVRWITDGVLEQLKVMREYTANGSSSSPGSQLAASIAKSIEEKRARLGREVQACITEYSSRSIAYNSHT